MARPSLLLAASALCSLVLSSAPVQAAEDTRCYELRVYHAAEGKLEDLNARFRNHTVKLFEKHGMTNIGYWVPVENPGNLLIYVLAFPSREARDASFKAFGADPEWKKAASESEKNGKLVDKIESTILKATDFSPEIKPSTSPEARTFEMRTYTTTPGNLDRLLKRFREHTVGLFAKHGMTNFGYWVPAAGPKAENTLVYILAHKSKEAAAESFKAFRDNPDWVKARKASEEEAGGSLTAAKDGVVSVMMTPTDYSPTR